MDGGVANHTPITVALELGATRIFVLPVGYPWLNREPANALGMALHALARIVEQKLEADVAASQDLADIHVMPTPDVADVSPADFSHTAELIDWGYRSARRQLAGANGHRPAADGHCADHEGADDEGGRRHLAHVHLRDLAERTFDGLPPGLDLAPRPPFDVIFERAHFKTSFWLHMGSPSRLQSELRAG